MHALHPRRDGTNMMGGEVAEDGNGDGDVDGDGCIGASARWTWLAAREVRTDALVRSGTSWCGLGVSCFWRAICCRGCYSG